jgi:hypothetical protein
MKLRLRENSIRLRLLQSEITRLHEHGSVSEKISFAPLNALNYSIDISEQAKEITAHFKNGDIKVEIPKALANEWIETEQIGLENEQFIDENLRLKIVLEKDFSCPERPLDPDNADAFPNPSSSCQ